MQKQYEEIRREMDVLNKQRGDDQRRIEKLGQENAALAEQVKALGANPVTVDRRACATDAGIPSVRRGSLSPVMRPLLPAAGGRCSATAHRVLSGQRSHAATTGDVPVCAGCRTGYSVKRSAMMPAQSKLRPCRTFRQAVLRKPF